VFWNNIEAEYPEVANKALQILLPFATSYLYETEFSAVVVLKSKYRFKLNVKNKRV
jgi:hypothetical protein